MGQKLSNSLSMIEASSNVLKSDKKLLIFPIISSIGVIAITAMFLIPIFMQDNNWKQTSIFDISSLPFLFFYYLLIYTVIIFSNSALVGAALIHMRGGNPTIGDGIRIAMDHFASILGYAVISSTIGVILKWVQEKFGILGKIISFITNLGWNVVTFLVIPILVVEGIGPIDAIKRSAQLLKKTWGEQLIGNMGISLFFGLITIGLVIIFLPLVIYVSLDHMIVPAIILGCIFVFIILLIIVISSTLNTIYIAALYRYAADGVISESFDENILKESFRRK